MLDRDLILVTGVPRSGTSLVTGLLAGAGAFAGECVGAAPWNPRGFFEHRHIRQQITKPYLASIGADPLGQIRLPDPDRQDPVPDWRERVVAALEADGYANGPAIVKDAKIALTWPVWRAAFPEARWVVVRRPLEQVARSCLRTHFMHAAQSLEGWRLWVRRYEVYLDQVVARIPGTYQIHTDPLVRGDLHELEHLCDALGLTLDEDRARAFLMPSAWDRGSVGRSRGIPANRPCP